MMHIKAVWIKVKKCDTYYTISTRLMLNLFLSHLNCSKLSGFEKYWIRFHEINLSIKFSFHKIRKLTLTNLIITHWFRMVLTGWKRWKQCSVLKSIQLMEPRESGSLMQRTAAVLSHSEDQVCDYISSNVLAYI